MDWIPPASHITDSLCHFATPFLLRPCMVAFQEHRWSLRLKWAPKFAIPEFPDAHTEMWDLPTQWGCGLPRAHILAIPGSNKTPDRQLKTNNHFPPGPLNSKVPGASAQQSDTRTALHRLVRAKDVTFFNLATCFPPTHPDPNVEDSKTQWHICGSGFCEQEGTISTTIAYSETIVAMDACVALCLLTLVLSDSAKKQQNKLCLLTAALP